MAHCSCGAKILESAEKFFISPLETKWRFSNFFAAAAGGPGA
jgi:hypothetical protein